MMYIIKKDNGSILYIAQDFLESLWYLDNYYNGDVDIQKNHCITIGGDYIYTDWSMNRKEVEMLYGVTKGVL